jgi:hypothetical protein
MLRGFAAFAESRSELFIRTETVLEWAASAPSVSRRHDRLRTIRRFACALVTSERNPRPDKRNHHRRWEDHRGCSGEKSDDVVSAFEGRT